jgi:hypothetical protein
MSGGNAVARVRTEAGSALPASLTPRDRAAVELVGRFGQLSAGHIRAALFAGTSKTPCDRMLKRLVERGYLARLPLRIIGGAGGGASQFVHQIGRQGWRLLGRRGDYWQARAVNAHSLAVADCFVALKTEERTGDLAVLAFEVEHEAYRDVAGVSLTPDAFARVGFAESRRLLSVWLEVDMGTERASQILEKCSRYWHAYENWGGSVYPRVLFVAPDDARKSQLIRMIASVTPREAQELFRVCELANLLSLHEVD